MKIVRGTFSPVAEHYDQELRRLLERLLQREPSLRPSVRQLLGHPILLPVIYNLYLSIGSLPCVAHSVRPTVEECLRRADSRQTSLKMMFAVQRAFPRWRHMSKRPACLHELSVSHGKPWKTEGFFHVNCIISLAVCSAAG